MRRSTLDTLWTELRCAHERALERRAALRLMSRWARARITRREIAERLNELGIPAPRGGSWGQSTVSAMLASARRPRKIQKLDPQVDNVSSASVAQPSEDLTCPSL